MDNKKLAERLFVALASGDDAAVRQLCSPDLEATQNQAAAMDLDTLLGFAAAARSVLKSFRYEDAIRSATESGFVEEHTVRGTLPDGSDFELAVCLVGEVRGGRITSLREYFDSAAAAKLAQALT